MQKLLEYLLQNTSASPHHACLMLQRNLLLFSSNTNSIPSFYSLQIVFWSPPSLVFFNFDLVGLETGDEDAFGEETNLFFFLLCFFRGLGILSDGGISLVSSESGGSTTNPSAKGIEINKWITYPKERRRGSEIDLETKVKKHDLLGLTLRFRWWVMCPRSLKIQVQPWTRSSVRCPNIIFHHHHQPIVYDL